MPIKTTFRMKQPDIFDIDRPYTPYQLFSQVLWHLVSFGESLDRYRQRFGFDDLRARSSNITTSTNALLPRLIIYVLVFPIRIALVSCRVRRFSPLRLNARVHCPFVNTRYTQSASGLAISPRRSRCIRSPCSNAVACFIPVEAHKQRGTVGEEREREREISSQREALCERRLAMRRILSAQL